MLDRPAVLAQARRYERSMVRFLRDLIAIPSESGHEGPVIDRIRHEMKRLAAFDRIHTDGMGNLLGQIGRGRHVIAIDAHVDTVGVGDRSQWRHDPYAGRVSDGVVFGRGAGDQKGAIPAMVYAGRILRNLKLPGEDWTLHVCFTVSEENCDGLCWQYIVRESGLRPDCVIVTDSTNCVIHRGQRGRMEIGVTVKGKSCHASMPHRGRNAVAQIARVITEIEKLNPRLASDDFLGQGTIAVTHVECDSPSLCAVPDRAYIHLDRRLTAGETRALALRQVRAAVRRADVPASVRVLRYTEPSYTGLVYPTEKFFPGWVMAEDATAVRAAAATYRRLFRRAPKIGRWTFSTNAVAIAGMFGIPCVGFGPADERVAHTVGDCVPIEHLVRCAAFYAAFPGTYCEIHRTGKDGTQ